MNDLTDLVLRNFRPLPGMVRTFDGEAARRWLRSAAALWSICAVALLCAPNMQGGEKTTNGFVIRHVRVFDGESMRDDCSVLVRNGKVESFGARLKTPHRASVIDGRGRTLLPGLIDAHTHIRSRQDLEQSLILGVTTDICMLMDLDLFHAIKEEQRRGVKGRAELFSSGYAATAPGGHGTEKGLSLPTISDPRQAQAWVDDRIAEGSEFIKIMYENGGDTGQGGRPSIDKATLQALVVAAHRRGKLAVVHIHSERQAFDAVEAGADGLAHLFSHAAADSVDPRFASTVAAHHAFVIPTLTVLESVCNQNPGLRMLNDEEIRPYILSSYTEQLRRNINHGRNGKCMIALDAVPALAAAHVPILAGTDAGNPGTAPGASLHGELESLVAAGLTPLEALVSATSATARAFHLSDRGRIAPGLRADLLLVDGNPAAEIRVTRHIQEIWQAGVPVVRSRDR